MIFRGTVFSEVLQMDTGVTILAPVEYRAGGTPKVAYVLHGLNANNGSWAEYSMLPTYAREYDVVFVLPEVGRSYYFDMRYGQRFFSYVADELPGLIANVFNISSAREDTAVLGASMGGYGALKCALSRPERFGVCCAFSSGSLYLREFIADLQKHGDWEKAARLVGEQRVRDLHAILGDDLRVGPEDELTELAERMAAKAKGTRFYAACGTGDGFHKSNVRFRDDMRRLGYDYAYEEWAGEHEWAFFDAAIRKALVFCYGEGSGRKL